MNPSCEVVAPVFEEYKLILTRFIKSRVKDSIDSQEILSEVLMKIYDNCEKLDEIRKVEAWLITIAKNTIHDFFREKNRFQKDEQWQYDPVLESESDTLKELEKCVPPLLDKLPEKYALPLIDYELNGIPQKSLTTKYSLSESGIKSRIQRGRKLLKQQFQEYCGHLINGEESCVKCDC